MSFQGTSGLTIKGCVSLIVAGDQHNNYTIGESSKGVRMPTTLDQYRQVKTGEVRLKKKIAETTVKRWDVKGWGNLNACRIASIASIQHEDKEEEFLYVQYKGPDAIQAYEQDLKTFSSVKRVDVNWLELFGYINCNAFPALVFYNALVPVSHIIERNGFSAILQIYFTYLAIAQGLDALTLREVWVGPSTGELRGGPYVDMSTNLAYRVWSGVALALPDSDRPSLGLGTYSNTGDVFRYLVDTLPACARNIIKGIGWSNKRASGWPANSQDTKTVLSSLPGTVYCRISQKIIARFPGGRERWYYDPWKERFEVPDVMQENVLVLRDGSIRFTFKQSVIEGVKSFKLHYYLRPGRIWDFLMNSWMSQAYSIFRQLGIKEDVLGEYSILSYFWLCFEREQNEDAPYIYMGIPNSMPIYLFIRPIPRPSDDEDRWNNWAKGTKYYWSLESSGKEEMSENQQLRLGLPGFRVNTEVVHYWWDCDAFEVIRMVCHNEGFNPTSMDLSNSLDLAILEVEGNNPHSEEVGDDDDDDNIIPVVAVKPAQLCKLLPSFENRIQWLREHRSQFMNHTQTLSLDDIVLDGPSVD